MQRAAAAVVLLIVSALFAVFAATAPKGKVMVTTADAALMLQRQGARLFEGGSQTLTQLELSVARTDFRGLAIASPAQVQADTEQTVPLVVLVQQSILRAWEVPEQYNLMLAVSEVESGTVRIARALVDPKDEEPVGARAAARPPKPTGTAATGIATKAYRFDIRLSPNHAGSLAVSAILFDTVSNTSTVALAGRNPRASADPPAISPRPNPSQGLPTYAGMPRSLQVPRSGVAFAVEMAGGPNAMFVHGAFAKVLALHEDLPVPQGVRDNGVDRHATAVVPLTIAVIGLDAKRPRTYALAVPVYGTVHATPGQVVSGQFAVGIPADPPLAPGHYVAYAFMDGVPYGPHRMHVP